MHYDEFPFDLVEIGKATLSQTLRRGLGFTGAIWFEIHLDCFYFIPIL